MTKSKPKLSLPIAHQDEAFFKAALSFTEAETGFRIQLIEKDYFCSLY